MLLDENALSFLLWLTYTTCVCTHPRPIPFPAVEEVYLFLLKLIFLSLPWIPLPSTFSGTILYLLGLLSQNFNLSFSAGASISLFT